MAASLRCRFSQAAHLFYPLMFVIQDGRQWVPINFDVKPNPVFKSTRTTCDKSNL